MVVRLTLAMADIRECDDDVTGTRGCDTVPGTRECDAEVTAVAGTREWHPEIDVL